MGYKPNIVIYKRNISLFLLTYKTIRETRSKNTREKINLNKTNNNGNIEIYTVYYQYVYCICNNNNKMKNFMMDFIYLLKLIHRVQDSLIPCTYELVTNERKRKRIKHIFQLIIIFEHCSLNNVLSIHHNTNDMECLSSKKTIFSQILAYDFVRCVKFHTKINEHMLFSHDIDEKKSFFFSTTNSLENMCHVNIYIKVPFVEQHK